MESSCAQIGHWVAKCLCMVAELVNSTSFRNGIVRRTGGRGTERVPREKACVKPDGSDTREHRTATLATHTDIIPDRSATHTDTWAAHTTPETKALLNADERNQNIQSTSTILCCNMCYSGKVDVSNRWFHDVCNEHMFAR